MHAQGPHSVDQSLFSKLQNFMHSSKNISRSLVMNKRETEENRQTNRHEQCRTVGDTVCKLHKRGTREATGESRHQTEDKVLIGKGNCVR